MRNYVKLIPTTQEKITTTTEQVHYVEENLDCYLKKSTVNVDSSMKFYNTPSLEVWSRTVNNNTFVSLEPSLDFNSSSDKEVKGTFIDNCFEKDAVVHVKEELYSNIYLSKTLRVEISSVRSSDNDDVLTKVKITDDTGSTGIDVFTFDFINDKCEAHNLTFGCRIGAVVDSDLENVKEYFNSNTTSKVEKTNYILDILKQSLTFSLDKVDYCDDKDKDVIDKSDDYFDKEPILIEDVEDLKDALELLNDDVERSIDDYDDNIE